MSAPETSTTRPFDEVRDVPAQLRPSRTFIACGVLAVLAGLVLGSVVAGDHPAQRALAMTFYSSAFLYLVISVVDFREHFLLEKALTGRMLAWRAVPIGETLNHMGSGAIILLALILPRPVTSGALDARDLVALALPLAFLALGLRDEIVYHRRRATHREDILHTTAHLCAGAMFAGWLPLRLIDWATLTSAAR